VPGGAESPAQQYHQLRYARPEGATELVLVRHGESEAAVDGTPFALHEGHGDPALSPLGREQADKVCARLATMGVDAIYVTSLQRTAQTAAPLAEKLGLPVHVERDLREVFLGEWEGGLYRKMVLEGEPRALEAFRRQRWDVIPGAESNEALWARVRGAIERIVAAHRDQRVAVFSHGGVIGAAIAMAADSTSFAFTSADNASISVLVVNELRWIVRSFNDAAHLD
jgi:probable phosphoglycerate mutase